MCVLPFGDTPSADRFCLQVSTALVSGARQASADMEKHFRISHMVQEKQLEVAQAADDVSSVLAQLVVKTQAGMQELNGTISEVKDSLRSVYHHDWVAMLWVWFQDATLHFLRSASSICHRYI